MKTILQKASVDHVYVQHNFGKYATATAGRQDLMIGNGLVYDDYFEGAVGTVGTDKLNASVAYGYLQGGSYINEAGEKVELDKSNSSSKFSSNSISIKHYAN